MSKILENKLNDIDNIINKLKFRNISSLQESKFNFSEQNEEKLQNVLDETKIEDGLDNEVFNEKNENQEKNIKEIERLVHENYPDHKYYIDMINSFIKKDFKLYFEYLEDFCNLLSKLFLP